MINISPITGYKMSKPIYEMVASNHQVTSRMPSIYPGYTSYAFTDNHSFYSSNPNYVFPAYTNTGIIADPFSCTLFSVPSSTSQGNTGFIDLLPNANFFNNYNNFWFDSFTTLTWSNLGNSQGGLNTFDNQPQRKTQPFGTLLYSKGSKSSSTKSKETPVIDKSEQNLYKDKEVTQNTIQKTKKISTQTKSPKIKIPTVTLPKANDITKTSKTQRTVKPQKKSDFRKEFVKTAQKYMGYNESDGTSKAISQSKEWCADFIKFVLDKTYAAKGLQPPAGLEKEPDMPHLRVENIKNWGIHHNMYIDLTQQENKAEFIKNKVKVGDILILRENGASHTGFVTKVNNDGSFETIEGNRYDKVATGHYSATDKDISGFVQVV